MEVGFFKITWADILDILLVAIILYYVYRSLKTQMANLLLVILFFFFLIYEVVHIFQMDLLMHILDRLAQIGFVIVIIIFQPEIRKFMLSYSQISLIESLRKRRFDPESIHLEEIVTAIKIMSATHTGALIVFQKRDSLEEIAKKGDIIEAEINSRILLTIFQKNSPMHDGAVIIANGKIQAARCILPMDTTLQLPQGYGTRHRAALSLSNEYDSVIVVISEERGEVSVAYKGNLQTQLEIDKVKSAIESYLTN
ncbi:MAG: diadenylate cyclase CdaA [Bacteroidia bacterium]|nr:diadenylate cyclase CdaA [Bacteroidia bacterium]MDW8300985.1 diadenylate cyclase CdaA [Bacteroidia bacterium]